MALLLIALAAPRTAHATPPAAAPPEGWIWQTVLYAAHAERRLRDDDASLRRQVGELAGALLLLEGRIEAEVAGDLGSFFELATALQLIEARGKLDAPLAALGRDVAFRCHELMRAATEDAALRTLLGDLLRRDMRDGVELEDVVRQTLPGLFTFSRTWFARGLAATEPSAEEHARAGHIERFVGNHEQSIAHLQRAFALQPEVRHALALHTLMLESGRTEAEVAAFEAQAAARFPALTPAFAEWRRDVSERLDNERRRVERPTLDADATVLRASALVRHGRRGEAEALVDEARARFPKALAVWRVAAGLRQDRGDREGLAALYREAEKLGLSEDERLSEMRLVGLAAGVAEGALGQHSPLADLAPLEAELAWLAGRSRRHALNAELVRSMPLFAAAAATSEAPAREAAVRSHIEAVLEAYGDEPAAWELAIAGLAVVRRLDSDGGALLARLEAARGAEGAAAGPRPSAALREQVAGWIQGASAAYALRGRSKAPIARTQAGLGRAASESGAPLEQLLRAAGPWMQAAAARRPVTAKEQAGVRAALAAARDGADAEAAGGRLIQQAAVAGLATVELAAGRKEASEALWREVRAIAREPLSLGHRSGLGPTPRGLAGERRGLLPAGEPSRDRRVLAPLCLPPRGAGGARGGRGPEASPRDGGEPGEGEGDDPGGGC